MKNLTIDSGVKEYRINGNGLLRFNPGDPNLYTRFMDAADKIKTLENDLAAKAKAVEDMEDQESRGAAALRLMQDADRQIKDLLDQVFGNGNSFDQVLGGVNVLAIAGNGQRVITNLLEALQPILVAGAQGYAKQQVDTAVTQAKRSRAKRVAQA